MRIFEHKGQKVIGRFMRTCQECGHTQEDTEPKKVTDSWLEKQCRKCKSSALDFGSEKYFDANNKPIDLWDEEDEI